MSTVSEPSNEPKLSNLAVNDPGKVYLEANVAEKSGITVPELVITQYLGAYSSDNTHYSSNTINRKSGYFQYDINQYLTAVSGDYIAKTTGENPSTWGEGQRTIFIQGINSLGYETPVSSDATATNYCSVYYDKTKPTVSSSFGLPAYTNSATVSMAITGASDSGSGIITYAISGTGVASGYTGSSTSAAFTLTSGEGTKAVTLTVTDLAGNSSSTSGSIILDTTPPVPTIKCQSSAVCFKKGDMIPYEVTFSEAIDPSSSPAIVINGSSCALSEVSSTDWTGIWTVPSSLSDGTYAISVSAKDLAGNSSASDSSSGVNSVLIDSSSPAITISKIYSSHTGYTAYATATDTIYLAFTASDANLSSVTAYIASHTIACTLSSGATSYTGASACTVDSGDSDGVAAYSVVATDKAGNVTTVKVTADGSAVTIDETAPTLTFGSMKGNSTYTRFATGGDTISLGYTVSDAGVGISSSAVTSAHFYTSSSYKQAATSSTTSKATYAVPTVVGLSQTDLPDGAVTCEITVADELGNSKTYTATPSGDSEVSIDRTAPVLSVVKMTGNANYSSYATAGDTLSLSYALDDGSGSGGTSVTAAKFYTNSSYPQTAASSSVTKATYSVPTAASLNQTELPDGSVYYAITVSDELGNSYTYTGSPGVTLDRTAPTISGVTMTGNSSHSTFATAGDTISLKYSLADAGIGLGTSAVTSATLSTDPSYPQILTSPSNTAATYSMPTITSLSQARLPDGTVTYTLIVADKLGNSATFTGTPGVTVDRTPPTVSGVSAKGNASYQTFATAGDTVALSYTVSDSGSGGVSVTSATFSTPSGSAQPASTKTTSEATYKMPTVANLAQTSLPDGSLSYSITVADELGNTATYSGASGVTVDRTPPAISGVTMKGNSAYSSFATSGDTITLDYTLADAGIGTPSVSSVKFYTDASYELGAAAFTTSEATYSTPTVVKLDQTKLPDGVVWYELIVSDKLGNTATYTGQPGMAIDRTAPALSGVKMTGNANYSSYATAGDTLSLSYSLSDATNSCTVTSLYVYSNSSYKQQIATPTTSAATYTVPPTVNLDQTELPDGAVTYELTVADELGNAKTYTAQPGVTVDRTGPTISGVTMTGNTSFQTYATAGDTISLKYSLADTGIGLDTNAVTSATLSTDPSYPQILTSPSNTAATYSMPTITSLSQAKLPDGTVTCTLIVADKLGNSATFTGTPGVTVDRTPPTVSGVSAKGNASHQTFATAGDTVALSYTVSDSGSGGVSVTSATFSTPSGSAQPASTKTTSEATYEMPTVASLDKTSLPDGSLSYSITVADELGNTTTYPGASGVTVDRTPPAISNITMTGNATYKTFATAGDTITLSYSLSDATGSISVTSADFYSNSSYKQSVSSASTSQATYLMPTVSSLDQTKLPDGGLTYELTVADELGNSYTYTNTGTGTPGVSVDRTAPTITVNSVIGNSTYHNLATIGDTVKLSYTLLDAGSNGVSVKSAYFYTNASYKQAATPPSTATTSTYLVPDETKVSLAAMPDNQYVWYDITVQDELGNSYELNAKSAVIMNRSAPTVSGMTLTSGNSVDPSFATAGDKIKLDYTVNGTNGGLFIKSAYVTTTSGTTVSTYELQADSTPTLSASATSATAESVFTIPTVAACALANLLDGYVTYSIVVGDKLDNISQPFTGTSAVQLDRSPPVISMSVKSSNTVDGTFATSGNTITLDYTVSDSEAGGVSATSAYIYTSSSYPQQLALGTASAGGEYINTYTVPTVSILNQIKLPDGGIGYSVTVTDKLGNTATYTPSSSTGVTLDRTAPTPTNVAMTSGDANDSGFATAGDTMILSYTLNDGSGSGGSSVTSAYFYTNGTYTQVAKTIAATQATYQVPAVTSLSQTNLPDGAVSYSLTVKDKLGNSATYSAATSVAVDRTPPSLTFGSMSGNASSSLTRYATNGDTITLNYSLSDSGVGSPSATGADFNTPSGAKESADSLSATSATLQVKATYSSTDLPDGLVTYEVTVADKIGNSKTYTATPAATTGVTVDRTPPSLSFTSMTGNTNYPRFATAGNIITLSYTLNDGTGIGLNSVTSAYFYSSASYLQKVSNPSATQATYTVPTITGTSQTALPDGAVSYQITAADALGNSKTTTYTPATSVGVAIDRTGPTMTLVGYASDHTAHTGYAKVGAIVTLKFTAADAGAGIAAPTVVFTPNGGVSSGTVSQPVYNSTNSDYEATYKPGSSDSEGQIGYTVSLSDVLGNAATALSGSGVIFDKTVPSLGLVSMASDNGTRTGYAKNGSTITLNFTASDTYLALVSEMSGTLAGKAATMGTTTTAGSYTSALTLDTSSASYTQGSAAYSVTVYDLAGNSTTASSGLASAVIIDTVNPIISSVKISSGHTNYPNYATNGDAIILTIGASDTTAGLDSASATIAGNSPETISTSSASYTLTNKNGLSDGLVTFSVTETDKAGNFTTATAVTDSSWVAIDRTGPQITLVDFLSGNTSGPTTYAKAGDPVYLKFSLSDPAAGTVAGAGVSSTSDQAVAMFASNQKTAFTMSANTLTAGVYTATGSAVSPDGYAFFTLTAKDALGNTTTQALADAVGADMVTIDTTAPLATGTPVKTTGTSGYVAGFINAADVAGTSVKITATLSSSACVGDQVELLHGGASFSTKQVHTITTGEPGSTIEFDVPGSLIGSDISDGDVKLSTKVTDTAGNAPALSGNRDLDKDVVLPTATITSEPTNKYVNAALSLIYGLTLSDDQTPTNNLTPDKISFIVGMTGISGGTVSVDNSTPLSPTITLKTLSGNGVISFQIAQGAVVDEAGNPSNAVTSGTFTVDNIKPTVIVTKISSATACNALAMASSPVEYTVTYSETCTYNWTSVSAYVPSGSTAAFGSSYEIDNETTISATVKLTSFHGRRRAGILIPAGAITDLAGNKNDATTTSPTVLVENTVNRSLQWSPSGPAGCGADVRGACRGSRGTASAIGTGARPGAHARTAERGEWKCARFDRAAQRAGADPKAAADGAGADQRKCGVRSAECGIGSEPPDVGCYRDS